ncbi:MAG TPA: adenylyltransferase/cytidyltransferase family protein [Candidatus Paceibacterota bacterium]|nr:adenylyltransferase/cytidyltransferase family protein [Candidatus Paceibacterota bacterium]
MKKVLCFGTFDILHKGHEEFLRDAKAQSDFLIVLVISDNLVYENKKRFPRNNQKTRAINLRKLGLANKIIAVSDDTEKNINLIKKINPDVIVLGYDQNSDFLEELKKYKLKTKYYKSKKFAGGIHSSLIKS